MMKKLLILGSGAVGYVLGARAGRERYDQIRRLAGQVKDDPRVQEKAAQAADLAKEKAPVVAEAVKDTASTAAGKASAAASTATDKVTSDKGTDREDLEAQLHPDSTARQDDPYPQGDLP